MIIEGIHLAIIDINTETLDYTIDTFSKLNNIRSITVFTTNIKCVKLYKITYCYLIKNCKTLSEMLHEIFNYFREKKKFRIFIAYSGEILLGSPLKIHKNLDGAFYKQQILDSFIWQLREINLLKKWYFQDNYALNPQIISNTPLRLNKIKGNYVIISLQKQSFNFKPNLPNCFYQLACYYLINGNLTLAETYFRLKLKDNPEKYITSRCYLALSIIYKTLITYNKDYFKLLKQSIRSSPQLLESSYFYIKWSLESNNKNIIKDTLQFLNDNKVDLLSEIPPENCLLPIDYRIYQYELIYFYLKALLELYQYSDALNSIKLLLLREDLPLLISEELLNIKNYLIKKILNNDNSQELFKSNNNFREVIYCEIIKNPTQIYICNLTKNISLNSYFNKFIIFNNKINDSCQNYLIFISKYQNIYCYQLYRLFNNLSLEILKKTPFYIPTLNKVNISKTFKIANISNLLLKTNNICQKENYHPDLYLNYNTVFYYHDTNTDDITYLFNCLHLLHTGIVLIYYSLTINLHDYLDFKYLKNYLYNVSGWSINSINNFLNKCTIVSNNRNTEFLKKSLNIPNQIFWITKLDLFKNIAIFNCNNIFIKNLTIPIDKYSDMEQIKDKWIIIVPPKYSINVSQFLLITKFIHTNPDLKTIFVVENTLNKSLLINFKLTYPESIFNTEPCDIVNTEPCDIVNTEPCDIVNTEPCDIVNTESCDIVNTEPCDIVNTEIYFFYSNYITPILTNNLIKDYQKIIKIHKII